MNKPIYIRNLKLYLDTSSDLKNRFGLSYSEFCARCSALYLDNEQVFQRLFQEKLFDLHTIEFSRGYGE